MLHTKSREARTENATLFGELSQRRIPVHSATDGGCVTLNALRAGTLAEITGFADPEHPVSRRLFDLGFAPGVPVRLRRKAPLRDPLVVEIAGAELVLRGADASRILVRHCTETTSLTAAAAALAPPRP